MQEVLAHSGRVLHTGKAMGYGRIGEEAAMLGISSEGGNSLSFI
jgi:hypothetical protein